MTYSIGIAQHETYTEAWAFDLIGCCSARELIPVAIDEHRGWLERHGEVVPDAGEVEIVEEVDVADYRAADGEFCFAADTFAVSPDEAEMAIRRMGYARRDLIELIGRLPKAFLDWEPPASAMAYVHEWAPDARTARAIVQHIASTDFYYRHGLHDGEVPAMRAVAFDLDEEREQLIARLRSLTDEERARVFWPKRPWRRVAEAWSLRKVLRRTISHERFHTKEIEQRLGWLLLGVPELRTSKQPVEGATVHD